MLSYVENWSRRPVSISVIQRTLSDTGIRLYDAWRVYHETVLQTFSCRCQAKSAANDTTNSTSIYSEWCMLSCTRHRSTRFFFRHLANNAIITGSIARSAKRRYLIYSEDDFEVFRPAGATRCTDGGWNLARRRRPWVPPPHQISPSFHRPSLHPSIFPFLPSVGSIRGFAHAAGVAAVRRCLRFLILNFSWHHLAYRTAMLF